MLLVHFLIAFAIFFPIVLFVITLSRAYQEDGDPFNLSILLFILILGSLFFTSCTKEDIYPPLCNGGCNAEIIVDLPQDSNGFYYVTGNRFNIEVFANGTNEYYWYNDSPFIEAKFEGDVVQGSSIYLSRNGNSFYTKRIVGPIFDEMIGDTLTISGDVYWDGGRKYKIQDFSIKFIVK